MTSLTINGPSADAFAGQSLPKASTFTNSSGEVATYFFNNNPWKLSTSNNCQKFFRYCIICGENKFSDAIWSKVLDNMWEGPPTICKKDSCWDALASVPGFVSRKHYMIETKLDQSQLTEALLTESFEQIGEVETMIRFDKVNASEDEMPNEYRETYIKLESIPVETRSREIDKIYFDYKEKNNIVVGKYMTDTSDPFLKALAIYRQKSMKILKSQKK